MWGAWFEMMWTYLLASLLSDLASVADIPFLRERNSSTRVIYSIKLTILIQSRFSVRV